MVKSILTEEEALSGEREGIDLKLLERVKEEYVEAMRRVRSRLSEKRWMKKLEINYNPEIYHDYEAFASVKRNATFEFSFPNRILGFDVFPGVKAKVGSIAHEVGHLVDREHSYHGSDAHMLLKEEYNKYVTPEQRANLWAFLTFPEELYEKEREIINFTFRRWGVELPEEGVIKNFVENLYAVSLLGSCGLERRRDVVDFFSNLYVEFSRRGILKFPEMLEKYVWYSLFGLSLAGLATPPELNTSNYGVREREELKRVKDELLEFFRTGKLKRKVRVVTRVNGYSPFKSVNLGYVDKKKALQAFESFIPMLKEREENYGGYWEDYFRQTQHAKNWLERILP